MMFAHREKCNVLDEHDFVVLLVELLAERDMRVLFPLPKNLAVHARDAVRRVAQAFAVRVFTDAFQQQPHRFADLLLINRRVIWHSPPSESAQHSPAPGIGQSAENAPPVSYLTYIA